MTRDPQALLARAEVVIVGGGLAGAATAYGLTRRGADVLVLETEAVAGVHASGRNAALAYRFIAEPQVRALARRGRDFLAAPPADFEASPTVGALAAALILDGQVDWLDAAALAPARFQPPALRESGKG
jgi:D-arginine dehydrogenase